jgi:type VI protein secretion system component VasF
MKSMPTSGMPSPDRAERNQRRKLAFVPMWPLVAAVLLMVVVYLLVR